MSGFPIRSPASKVQGLVYFGRMLDKIRLHADGKLPEDYRPNLGEKMDSHCVNFLRVRYDQLVERVKEGGADEEILRWCLTHGRQPSQEDVLVWNEFMRKRGWNDEITEILTRRKKEAGMAGRSEIKTMFEFIDVDEGRSLPNAFGVERKATEAVPARR